MEAKHKRLHALGVALYGEGEAWDSKRHELVKAVTQGRTESSNDLTAAELDYIIDGISDKLERKRTAEAMAAAELESIAASNPESAVHEAPPATPTPQPMHTEAPMLVWFDMVISGVQMNVTMRAGTTADETIALLREAAKVAGHLKQHGAIPVLRREATEALSRAGLLPSVTQPSGTQPIAERSTPAPAPVVPHAPSAPAMPPTPAPAASNGGEKGGSGQLRTITVKGNKVEFEVEGLKYPLSDSRGAKTVAALFDPALGWTEAHFVSAAIYQPQGLIVDWIKKDKYYDVTRVHA